jgi:hypothetical protein
MWQASIARDPSVAHQVLVEQVSVDKHSQSHPAIQPGLEFEQQVNVPPLVAESYPPDHVVLAFAQGIADKAARQRLMKKLQYPKASARIGRQAE